MLSQLAFLCDELPSENRRAPVRVLRELRCVTLDRLWVLMLIRECEELCDRRLRLLCMLLESPESFELKLLMLASPLKAGTIPASTSSIFPMV